MARLERLLVKTGTLVREAPSGKAWLVDLDVAGEVWLPKSEVEWDGGSNWSIPEWLCEAKGIG
jgi:hypothetical protein